MDAILKEILAMPLANLLIVAGIIFLFVSVAGNISGKIAPGKSGRIASGAIGAALLIAGFSMFSSTGKSKEQQHEVNGTISAKWAEMRSKGTPFGDPISGEIPSFDGVGRFQSFQGGGIISWHPETGAHAVWGFISVRWLQIGREQFGYPITDESPVPDGRGRFNHFRAVHLPGKPEASIYWTPETGAHEIYGAIRDKWAEMGWERSDLGYPVSAEQDYQGGRIQRFQRGALFWTPQGGAVVQ